MVATARTDESARTMTDDHKQALAVGREQGRAIRAYLEALRAYQPKRGRKRTADGIERRLVKIDQDLRGADALRRLHLIQERMNLQSELEGMGQTREISALEEAFVMVAGEYGQRKGISYPAWREAGVEARVLTRAGITRGGT